MPYIHCSHDNYYKPSESLKNLFEELIVKPFEHDLPALSEDIKNNRIYYWEDIARILKQGQSDFDEVSFDKPSNEYYFPKDKVSQVTLIVNPVLRTVSYTHLTLPTILRV